MDVNVDSDIYIPDSEEHFLFNALKDIKVSFVALLIIIIGIYVGIFMLLGNGSSSTDGNPLTNVVILLLEILLWCLLLFIIYVNIKNYDAKNYDFQQNIKNLFNTKIAEMSIHAQENDSVSSNDDNDAKTCESSDDNGKKEVFHVFGNKYSFKEAKEVCETHGARLASYEEIERAYDNGANWCSYGWSQDQMAFFPTQQKVFNELKKIHGHKHDCGRPGINGGYFKNPYVKFGVNCYGVKPKAKDSDKNLMHSINHTPYIPKGEVIKKEEDELEKYIIYPFNKDKWSKINS